MADRITTLAASVPRGEFRIVLCDPVEPGDLLLFDSAGGCSDWGYVFEPASGGESDNSPYRVWLTSAAGEQRWRGTTGIYMAGTTVRIVRRHDPVDDLRRVMSSVDAALRVEGVPPATAERILNRIIYGGPDPHRIYRAEPVPASAASALLHVWLDVVLGGAGAGHCPTCWADLTAVLIGRRGDASGWFQVEPCGCLVDIEPDPSRRSPATGIEAATDA